MPLVRYFLFAGGLLIALLFAFDAYSPQQAVASADSAASLDKSIVRIRSNQKWPERVVYDTATPIIVPDKSLPVQAAAIVPATDPVAQSRVHDTFAQFAPAETAKPEVQVRKRKIAKNRSAPLRLAQQSHFDFFGPGTW